MFLFILINLMCWRQERLQTSDALYSTPTGIFSKYSTVHDLKNKVFDRVLLQPSTMESQAMLCMLLNCLADESMSVN